MLEVLAKIGSSIVENF